MNEPKSIAITYTSLIFITLFAITLFASVMSHTYRTLEIHALKKQLVNVHQQQLLTFIKENCFGRWTAYSGINPLYNEPYVKGDCNETPKQSSARAMKIGQR